MDRGPEPPGAEDRAFDLKREALLLIGGDKGNDKRFYERAIPEAEQLWEAHLEHLEKEGER